MARRSTDSANGKLNTQDRLGIMATWKDGPRYAPRERPFGFAEPTSTVSLEAQPAPPVLPPAPAQAPLDYQMKSEVTPLAEILPVSTESRDPSEPFESHSAAMTVEQTDVASLGLPTTTTQRSPDQPFTIVSAPTTPKTWAPPPDSAQPVTVKRPVAWQDVLNAAYPPMLITMVVVGFVAMVETLIPTITLAIAPFFLIPRVRFRVDQLKKISYAILGILCLLWVCVFILSNTMYNVDLGMSWWVLLGCFGLAIADLILQYLGLRNGESPNITH